MSGATHFVNIQVTPGPEMMQRIKYLQQTLEEMFQQQQQHPQHASVPGSSHTSAEEKKEEQPMAVLENNLHITVCGLQLDDPAKEKETKVMVELQKRTLADEVQTLCREGSPRVCLKHPEVFLPLDPGGGQSRGPCAVVCTVDQAKSPEVMRVIQKLRSLLSPYLKERTMDLKMPYNPHMTLVSNCYHDNPTGSLLQSDVKEQALGQCDVSEVYLSRVGDVTESGAYRHLTSIRMTTDGHN